MELIKINEINGKKVISARELHAFLGIKKKFADWFKHRIEKYDFIEGQDYISFSLNRESGGKSLEYALSIGAAKELSMVEGNAKGKQARKYFIDCEEKLRAIVTSAPVALTQSQILLQSLQLLVNNEKAINQLEQKQNSLEQSVVEIEAKQTTSPEGYYAIAGYAALIKKTFDVKVASSLGRKATAMCKILGYDLGSIPHPRYGQVKTYPKEVLAIIFDNHYKPDNQ